MKAKFMFSNVWEFIVNHRELLIAISGGGLLSWFKWLRPNGAFRSGFYKASKGAVDTMPIINKLKGNINDIQEISIAKCVNGGGVPTWGSLLNESIIFSTDPQIVENFGEKHNVDKNFYKFFACAIEHIYSSIKVEELDSEEFKAFCNARGVKRINLFLIGLEREASYIMYVNLKEDRELTNLELNNCITSIKRLGRFVKKKYS